MNNQTVSLAKWILFGITTLMLLGFPIYHIVSYNNVLEHGTAYRIPCGIYDPYDPFSGRYVMIQPDVNLYQENHHSLDRGTKWVVITKDDKGRLQIAGMTKDRPTEGDYLPIGFQNNLRKFYMNEKLAPAAEKALRESQRVEDGQESACELEIKVLNGRVVSKELYINNIPIAEYCREHQ
ncbi:MAG: GDYXXLXY domain-containing protein [Planctomycetia bacterium]|jgi:hypothetical protein